jgi:serine protease Do
MPRTLLGLLLLSSFIPAVFSQAELSQTESPSLEEQFRDRSRTVAFVEYFVEREVDRQNRQGVALVLNDSGLLICLDHVFSEWIPTDQFKDIRVYAAGNPYPDGLTATYLGADFVNGWHYLQIEDLEKAAELFAPITEFPAAEPRIGDALWGIGMAPGSLDYVTYFRAARHSVTQPLPLLTGFTTTEVAVVGGPVFLEDGHFVGWGGRSLPNERDVWIGSDYFRANIRNPDESDMFLLAEPFLAEAFARIPTEPDAVPRPWVGVSGSQPLDKQTARFLGLKDQGAILISEVLPGTAAEESGLQDKDIVVKINDTVIPRLKPDSVVQSWFERQILLTAVGEPLGFTVLRDNEAVDVSVTPRAAPTSIRQAQRRYFEGMGFTAREFVTSDALQRREDHRDHRGLIVNFIRPNSPAATAGMQPGDWILEVDGTIISDYASGTDTLEASMKNDSSEEVVFMVRRANDTSVLRLRKP